MDRLTLAEIFRVIRPLTTDAFDRIEVAYWWLCEHHCGQGSWEYAAACRLGKIYKPGACQDGPENQEAYDALCEAVGCDRGVAARWYEPGAFSS